jgi:hypothetical protein
MSSDFLLQTLLSAYVAKTTIEQSSTPLLGTLTARGVYDVAATYVPNDMVVWDGRIYINILSCTGVAPPDSTYWLLPAFSGWNGSIPIGSDATPLAAGIGHPGVGATFSRGDHRHPVSTAADVGAIAATALGAANGVAVLDSGGKIPLATLPSSILGALVFQGVWDASTNSPAIPAAATALKGQYYRVSVAGTTAVDGISSWAPGDLIICDGTAWSKLDATADAVLYETTATRAGKVPAVGVLTWDTDQKKLYIGDGLLAGGNLVGAPQRYISTQIAPAAATTNTLPHGLSSTPVNVEGYYVCTQASGGYVIGDRVKAPAFGDIGSYSCGVTIGANATNVIARFGQTTPRVWAIDSTASLQVDASAWYLEVVASL